MTVRTTMIEMISRLRNMAQTGTSDYTVASTAYWSDEQLQDALDRNRQYINFEPLSPITTRIAGGSVEYKRYESIRNNWEEDFTVQDSVGNSIGGTLYIENAEEGFITFDTDQAGSARVITGYTYDMNKSASEVWRSKASHYSMQYDFSTDNHSIKRSQLAEQALKMAAYYESRAGLTPVVMWRPDVLH